MSRACAATVEPDFPRAGGGGVRRGLRSLLAVAFLTVVADRAAGQVDPSAHWITLRSPHFRIHAAREDDSLAVKAAAEAERAYALLAGELAPPRGTIDLVLADATDVSNGFASYFPSNRLTVYAVPPIASPALAEYDDWFRLVLTHEMAHVFANDRSKGIWRALQSVFGRAPGLFPNAYQPRWVGEGIATWYESHLTTSGRVHGTYHRSLLAAAAMNDDWVRPADAGLASPAWPAGLRPYAWGAEFFARQAALAGDSVVPRFIERSAGQWWPLAVARPLAKAGGERLSEAWERLRTPGPATPPADPEPEIIARGLRSEPHPRVSPDGSRFAFVRDDGVSDPALIVMDVGSRRVVATQRLTSVADLTWVGSDIIVSQLDFVSPVETRSDLYRWREDGRWERVTSGARMMAPFAMPDGTFGAIAVGRYALEAPVMRDGGFESSPLPRGGAWARIAWSPNGKLVVGARHLEGRWDVVTWPADRPEQVTALTDDPAIDRDPVWSGDTSVLFASEREGLSQIFSVAAIGGVPRRLTQEPTGAWEPAPLPDGSILFATLRQDGYALARRPVDRGVPVLDTRAVPTPVAPAPAVPLTIGGYSPWDALRPRYWLPLSHDERDAGFFAGAFTSGQDPVGRANYGAAIAVAPDPFRVEAQFAATYTRWKHAVLDLGVGQWWDGLRAVAETGDTVRLAERDREASLGVTWRWRRWRRAFSVRVGATLEDEDYFVDAPPGFTTTTRPMFAGGVIAARWYLARRPALAISIEDGVQLDARYARRWALSGAGWSDEWRGSAAVYAALPLPGFAHWVVAARATAARAGGTAPHVFELGGASGDPLVFIGGFAFGPGRRSFPLRGYPAGGNFTRVATGTVELRVPIVLVAKGMTPLPILLDRLSIGLFGEVGGGWRAGEPPTPTALRDVGAELVTDLGVFLDYPLRVRGGVAIPLTDGLGASRGEPRGYVAFGQSF
jgi:hypothetical protein